MREEGYYWVKYNGNWIIMELSKHPIGGLRWHKIGYHWTIKESDFEEIDEKRLTHESR